MAVYRNGVLERTNAPSGLRSEPQGASPRYEAPSRVPRADGLPDNFDRMAPIDQRAARLGLKAIHAENAAAAQAQAPKPPGYEKLSAIGKRAYDLAKQRA